MPRSVSSRPVRTAGLVAALALLAGCGGTTGTVDAASTAGVPAPSTATATSSGASASASGSEPVSASASAPADTAPDVADAVEPSGLTVTAVRAARHEGFDRVVFELAGSGTPGWRVEYVDTAAAQGSGDDVEVPGAATLQVSLQGVSYPYETGAAEVGQGAVPVSGTEHVAGVVYGGTFEGAAQAWIGSDAAAPFRVYSLTAPSRVVVEVLDAG